jgi:hypothetical protein
MRITPRSFFAATLAATMLVVPAIYAAPVDYTLVSGHPMSTKVKTVQLLLRNDTGMAIEVRAGETILQIAAGKTLSVKLPVGVTVVTDTATPHHKIGDVLVAVSTTLSGTTVAIG